MATQPRFEGQPAQPAPSAALGPTAMLTRSQWGPIVCGAFAGFALSLILMTLGAAVGISTTPPGQELGIGAAIWWLVTVIAAGVFAGWVLGQTVRRDRTFQPFILATVTWITGVLVLMLLLVLGLGNVLGGTLGGLGAGLGSMVTGPGGLQGALPAGAQLPQVQGEQVAGIATGVAWVLLASQLLGLGATILGARWGAPRTAEER